VPEPRAVYLHVGGHKTGTTFLQNVLWHNRAELKRDGFLYPGRRPADHVWANLDLRGASFKGHRAPQVNGAWERMVGELRDWDGSGIIDQELFSLAGPPHIARALKDLSFAEVHVVFTARDMARQLPAAWQEWVKNRDTLTYAEFLEAVRRESPQARRLRSLHDVPAILAKWSADLPHSQVHVITVPPPGADPGVLWQRFASVLRLDPARYRTDIPGTNTSLGAVEASVIRRLNELVPDVSQAQYDRRVKFHLAPQLSRRRGTKIELPEDAFAWAVEESNAVVAALTAAHYDVVGDLAELVPSVRPTGADPDRVPSEEEAEAAIAALAVLVRRPEKTISPATEDELRRLRARLQWAERRLQAHAALPPGERIKRTVVELSGQVGWLGTVHRAYRKLRRR
jgi:hypothetical protein